MLRTFKYAFTQAKIYGIMAKSYLGENYRELLRFKRVTDLYDHLFPGEHERLSENLLTSELQKRIIAKNIRIVIGLLDLLQEPSPLLTHMLRKYECLNLKSLLHYLKEPDVSIPVFVDLGEYRSIDLRGEGPGAQSDRAALKQLIAESPYRWLLPFLDGEPIFKLENRLDLDYYQRLWTMAQELPAKDRRGVTKLLSQEITLQNIIWAFRLRFFYQLDGDQAAEYLLPQEVDTHRAEVMKIFELPADRSQEWSRWKFAALVQDQLSADMEGIDPVRVENKALFIVFRRARLLFHQDLFTLTPLVSFIKLKELEARILLSLIEGIRLGIPEEEILAVTGGQR